MKTREDYADMEALVAKLGTDEPYFLLRAKDAAAPAAIQAWINRAGAMGADPSILDSATTLRREMIAWQDANGAKVPDLPDDQLTDEQRQERYRLQRLARRRDEIGQSHEAGRIISVDTSR